MTMEGGQLAIRGLRGLEGVYLVVEGISGPDEEAGMTEQLLREDAELCLRGMGMAPLGAGEWLTSSGAPHLYVRVDVARGDLADGELAGEPEKGDTAGFAATVQVREKVSLEREPGVRVMAPVWASQRVGQTCRADLQDGIRDSVSSLLKEFVEAYERANAA